MRISTLTLLAACCASTLAAPAAADPRGARATAFRSGGAMADYALNCRTQAYQCAVRAYQREDSAATVRWFHLAASRGSVPAMRSLGLLYLEGTSGMRADPQAALGWLYEAALRDDSLSMFALGRAFEEGVGVERDPALGRFWIARAANRGYRPARRALGEG